MTMSFQLPFSFFASSRAATTILPSFGCFFHATRYKIISMLSSTNLGLTIRIHLVELPKELCSAADTRIKLL
ncbi:hypothetical protein EDB83DRAFT_2366498 [Lactarius deliciosus]|nr:hypothetical protein EDB83DRAFT_2366498 [Lactarius deliciosus]